MPELSKRVRKQARDLISVAYTRELNQCLDGLEKKFNEWRKNTIDCWELKDFIHQFHDGASRDLYNIYNCPKSELSLLSRAILHGLLQKEELSQELFELSNALINKMKS